MTEELEFDYVIVGAGAARCVMANRLVRDGRYSVALVERGRMDNNRWIHIPATCFTDVPWSVNGVEIDRVADCSVMPALVSGNTNAPTMMIADCSADFVLADA